MPDLAVGVKSPGNTLLDLREKISFYLTNGTRFGLIINPDRRQAEIYLNGQDTQVLTENDTLDLSPVLPDLKIPVAELFRGV
jgi:Uma2 family endonuclease